jgi:hypothetical protein
MSYYIYMHSKSLIELSVFMLPAQQDYTIKLIPSNK